MRLSVYCTIRKADDSENNCHVKSSRASTHAFLLAFQCMTTAKVTRQLSVSQGGVRALRWGGAIVCLCVCAGGIWIHFFLNTWFPQYWQRNIYTCVKCDSLSRRFNVNEAKACWSNTASVCISVNLWYISIGRVPVALCDHRTLSELNRRLF